MTPINEAILNNFGQNNIDALENRLNQSEASQTIPKKAFTMVHTNTRTEVEITQANRMACGKAIIR